MLVDRMKHAAVVVAPVEQAEYQSREDQVVVGRSGPGWVSCLCNLTMPYCTAEMEVACLWQRLQQLLRLRDLTRRSGQVEDAVVADLAVVMCTSCERH